jgi:tRNA(Ile2) C34 agmatinyltransferase TiaS
MKCVTINPNCPVCGRTAKRVGRGGSVVFRCARGHGTFVPVTDHEYEQATTIYLNPKDKKDK